MKPTPYRQFTCGYARDCAPESMARDEARRLGYSVYVGEPCSRGHRGRRYVSSQRCVDCAHQAADSVHDRSRIDALSDSRVDERTVEVWDE